MRILYDTAKYADWSEAEAEGIALCSLLQESFSKCQAASAQPGDVRGQACKHQFSRLKTHDMKITNFSFPKHT